MKKRIECAAAALLMIFALSSCMGNASGTEREKTENGLAASYLELAEESCEAGDIETAIETLEKGYSETADKRIKNRLDELRREYDQSHPDTIDGETAK